MPQNSAIRISNKGGLGPGWTESSGHSPGRRALSVGLGRPVSGPGFSGGSEMFLWGTGLRGPSLSTRHPAAVTAGPCGLLLLRRRSQGQWVWIPAQEGLWVPPAGAPNLGARVAVMASVGRL